MGFVYGFQKDKLYGVDDINNIVANFTSAGVNTYEDLNGISKALAKAGVESSASESCKVVKDDTQLKIKPGVAFFSDGSTITVDKEGCTVDAMRYIYFKKDTETGLGYPVSSNTAPGEDDIPLAEYSNGILTDVREPAKSKINGFGTNVYTTYDYQKDNIEVRHEGAYNQQYTYQIDLIQLNTSPYVFKCVMVADAHGKFIGHGIMHTPSTDPNYAYKYSDNGCYRTYHSDQANMMIYGEEGKGKVYLSFKPQAEGIGVFLTVEFAPVVTIIDLNLKLSFC